MPLILQQQFPLGRFHATRWKQNSFEDRHGEWPPSPWRLLRALAARWIQYSRETGDDDVAARDELLARLAETPPEFAIPASTWRADPIARQYHKTGVEWTAKGKKDPAYKKAMTTLVPDSCRVIDPNEYVYWFWEQLELGERARNLLDELLSRMLYFGRAESFCRIRRARNLPIDIRPNCRLTGIATSGSPVLVAKLGEPLRIDSLLAASDDELLSGFAVPPGAAWHYATLPPRPTITRAIASKPRFPANLRAIQFAVGGRVYPQVRDWIRVTERFRGTALKFLARDVTRDRNSRFRLLPFEMREKYSLFSGKHGDESPRKDHGHPYFVLVPDENQLPTRLVCFRTEPFRSEEITALLAASKVPCSWRFKRHRDDPRDEWQLRFVPLPFETPLPIGLRFDGSTAQVWENATPFVIPGGRKRFRKNGRLRIGESAENLAIKLLTASGYPVPEVTLATTNRAEEWVAIHETHDQRNRLREDRARAVLPGYRLRLSFPEPVSGPICIGHSCHFGLGLFIPVS